MKEAIKLVPIILEKDVNEKWGTYKWKEVE